MSHNFTIAQTWEGILVQPEDRVHVNVSIWNNDRLQIEIIAPFYKKNPAPLDEVQLQGQQPTWKLWEHDVVEVFFVCSNGHYVETEFGPHGHYLILELDAPRNIIRKDIVCNYKTKFFGSRWKGFAEIPLSVFPDKIEKINLFAIFGYSPRTEYIRKAIREKKDDQILSQQKSTHTITFRGKSVEMDAMEISDNQTISHKTDLSAMQQNQNPQLETTNERIHLIWSSLDGDTPDFHQPHQFPSCPDLRNPID